MPDHMMVTWIRGLFKDFHGKLAFDPAVPLAASFEGEIEAGKIWTGQPERDRLSEAGVVVGNEIDVVLDLEVILDEDLERTGAIEYYREQTAP